MYFYSCYDSKKTWFQYFHRSIQLYFSFLGGIGFALLKGRTDNYLIEFGNGTIYFGWIGAIMGVIAIMAYSSFKTLSDIESVAPAFAVALTTLFYGYILKLFAVTFSEPE